MKQESLKEVIAHMLTVGYSEAQITMYLQKRQIVEPDDHCQLMMAGKKEAELMAAHKRIMDSMTEKDGTVGSIVAGVVASAVGIGLLAAGVVLLAELEGKKAGSAIVMGGVAISYYGLSVLYLAIGDVRDSVRKKLDRGKKPTLIAIDTLTIECIICEGSGFVTKRTTDAGCVLGLITHCSSCGGLGLR